MLSLKGINVNKSQGDNMGSKSKQVKNGTTKEKLHVCCHQNNKIIVHETKSVKSPFFKEKKVNPLKLIPQLCNQFYFLGWCSGSGGGLSIVQDGKIYCAPSGVQKERIKPEDMFILNEDGDVILQRPKNPSLKVSECLSLFMVAFKSRQAKCCIHIHSIYANLVTAFYSERNCFRKTFKDNNDNNNNNNNDKGELKATKKLYNEFRISYQEMIKGIKKGSTNETLQYNDTLVVPIIDNVLHERDLADSMQDAVNKYSITNAVLVRNHGCYIWGQSWHEAKTMAECYDYLFKLKVEAIKCGFDWMLEE